MSRIAVFAIVLLALWSGPAQALQESSAAAAAFSANTQSPLVGAPVDLRLVVSLPAGSEIVAWPDFPTQWPPFEILSVGERVMEDNGATVTYHQDLRAILWLPGEVQTPDILLSYRTPDDPRLIPLPVQPLYFSVPSVLASPDDPLLPFSPPVALPYIPLQLVVVIICPLITLAYILIQEWRKRRQITEFSHLDDVPLTDLDRAVLTSLQEIDFRAMEPAAVYSAVSDCLREYVDRQFGISNAHLTSLEVVDLIKSELPVPVAHRLQDLLTQSDIVKFALYTPDRREARRYLELSVRWIQAVARDLAQRSRKEVA